MTLVEVEVASEGGAFQWADRARISHPQGERLLSLAVVIDFGETQ